MQTVGVVVATFSDSPEKKEFWNKLAIRAVGSVINQTVRAHEIKRVHVDQPNALHIARNRGVAMCSSDFIIILDADDQLHPSYIEDMLAGEGDVRIPKIERFYWDGQHDPPHRIREPKTLLNWSHILIGAMTRRELFLKVGGFDDWPIWEDWHFWMKCWVEGAKFSNSEAIYQSYIRPDSRNNQKGNMQWSVKIRESIIPKAKAKGLIGEDWR